MAATSSLLANPDQSRESQHELLEIADQEARRLRELIDDTVEVGRLDSAKIEVDAEPANVADIVREVIAAMRNADGDGACDPSRVRRSAGGDRPRHCH